MGILTQWLLRYLKSSKLTNAWLVKGRLYLIRAACLALAVILSAFLGIGTQYFFGSFSISTSAATISFFFFAPCLILLAEHIWKSGKVQVHLKDGFDWEKWLDEQEQEDRLRLAGYGFGPEKVEERLEQIYDYYQSHRKLLRAYVLKNHVTIESIDEALSILRMAQSSAIDFKNANQKNGDESKKVSTKSLSFEISKVEKPKNSSSSNRLLLEDEKSKDKQS